MGMVVALCWRVFHIPVLCVCAVDSCPCVASASPPPLVAPFSLNHPHTGLLLWRGFSMNDMLAQCVGSIDVCQLLPQAQEGPKMKKHICKKYRSEAYMWNGLLRRPNFASPSSLFCLDATRKKTRSERSCSGGE